MEDMFSLFGIKIANITLLQATKEIERLVSSGGKHLVVTANPEIMLEARQNDTYRSVLQSASLVVVDGIGLVFASYLFGKPITSGRVTGVDLVESLAKASSEGKYSLFLAGSTIDILDKTTHYLSSKYSNIRIAGTYSAIKNIKELTIDKHLKNKEEADLISMIQATRPDILLLAFGHPRQEIWINTNIASLPIKLGIGIGGAFDYLSGESSRAPQILRRLYLEWLWRLINEPRRAGRIFKAVIIFPLYLFIDRCKEMFHMEHKLNK